MLSPSRQTTIMLALCVGLLAALPYMGTLHVPFQWDDAYYIAENPVVKSPGLMLAPGNLPHREWMNLVRTRPMAYLTFAANYAVHGLSVEGYHAVNIAVHAGVSVLVFALGLLLMRSPGVGMERAGSAGLAFGAAAVYATHPMQTEAVTYLFQRVAALGAFWYLTAAVGYLIAADARRRMRERVWGYGLAVLAAAVACRTRENSATLPVALALMDWAFMGPARARVRLVRLAPFALAALSIPLALSGWGAGGVGRAVRGYVGYARGEYLLTQAVVVLDYLRLIVLPVGQNIMHTVELREVLDPAVACAAGVHLVLAGSGAYLMLRRDGLARLGGFGVVWFYLTLLVESSVVPLPILMAEYRVYLPMAGLLVGAVALAGAYAPPRRVIMGAMVIAAVLSAMTVSRNVVWESRVALWEDTAAKSPGDASVLNNLGNALRAEGRPGEAAGVYERALAINPEFADAVSNLGLSYEEAGDARAAEAMYRRAIRLDPGHWRALNNLGVALMKRGDPGGAVGYLARATDERPDFAEGWSNLGSAQAGLGLVAEASQSLIRAIGLDPRMTEARFNLALVYMQAGRDAEARRMLESVIGLNPEDATARTLLEELR
jgi:Flp pilus assembly protein TadD